MHEKKIFLLLKTIFNNTKFRGGGAICNVTLSINHPVQNHQTETANKNKKSNLV